MALQNQGLKNSILYYPTINIPNGIWLRNALLYWDEVSSIVPDNFQDAELSSELLFLREEGFFRPLSPSNFLNNVDRYEKVDEFISEFFEILKTTAFKRRLQVEYNARIITSADERNGFYRVESDSINFLSRVNNDKLHRISHDKLFRGDPSANTFRVNDDKLSHSIVYTLRDMGLVSRERHGNWWFMEKNTAYIYMSLLAKYMAGVDKERTVPGTNNAYYQKLIFTKAKSVSPYPVFDLHLSKVLPMPKANVSFEKILDFKKNKNRKKELEKFQKVLTDFQNSLSVAPDEKALKDLVYDFKVDLKNGLTGLQEVLNESAIDTFMGGVKNLIGIKPLANGGLATFGLSKLQEQFQLGGNSAVVGMGGAALIELSHYYIQRRNQKKSTLRNSAFTYLYQLNRSSLIR